MEHEKQKTKTNTTEELKTKAREIEKTTTEKGAEC